MRENNSTGFIIRYLIAIARKLIQVFCVQARVPTAMTHTPHAAHINILSNTTNACNLNSRSRRKIYYYYYNHSFL